MIRAELPERLRAYKRTAEFTETSMPAGLRRMHETKNGVWGKIHVLEGKLLLRFLDSGEKLMLTPERFGIVCPRQAHEVEPFGAVRFYIEFHSEAPPAGDPHAAAEEEALQPVSPDAPQKPMHPKITGKIAPPGLDEAKIREVVDAFYVKVRGDNVLGPVFEAAIAPDQWPQHLGHMYDFWSSLLLGSGRYGGRPMPKHLGLPGLGDAHFVRWLALFKETVESLCLPETAAVFIDRAERIAQSFRLGLAFQRGEDTTAVEPLRAGAPATIHSERGDRP